MIRFTCTEPLLKDGDLELREGDSVTIEEDRALYFCQMGWGTADGIQSNERKPGAVVVMPRASSQQ